MNYFIPTLILIITFLFFFNENKKNKLNGIPGPKGVPIFGNLLDLKKDIHLKFQEYYYQYGNVFFIRMGKIKTVVLTEYPVIKEAFVDSNNSLIFMPRYQRDSRKSTSNWQSLINSNGDEQKHLKTIVLSEMTFSKLKKLENHLKDEAKHLCELLDQYSESGQTFCINNYIKMFSMNIIIRFLFGISFPYKSVEDTTNAVKVINEYFESAAIPIITDFIPFLKPVAKKQLKRFEDAYFHVCDHILEQVEIYKKRKLIDSRNGNNKEDDHTILDKLLKDFESGVINKKAFVGSIVDILVAGTDTSAHTIVFTIIEMINNPHYQDKLFNNIKESISEADFTSDEGISYSTYKSSIPFLQMVMKESYRKYPAGLLGLPHMTSEDSVINGYKIPAGTQIIQNIWATHRNKKYWDNPNKYIVERFEKDLPVDNNLIHFALGRRSCVGANLADSEIFTCLATLFKKYKFTNPSSTPLNEIGTFGVTYVPADTFVKVEKRF